VNDYDIFLDLFGKWCKMAKENRESEEARSMLSKAAAVYDTFTDEQRFEVDECVLRMQLWFGV